MTAAAGPCGSGLRSVMSANLHVAGVLHATRHRVLHKPASVYTAGPATARDCLAWCTAVQALTMHFPFWEG